MRTCLNLVTLQRGLDPIAGIKAAFAAGFAGVGLWADTFENAPDPRALAAEASRALDDHGLRAEELCFVGGWMWAQGEARPEAMDGVRRRAELAGTLGCPVLIACASGGVGDLDAAAADFSEACDLAAEHGVALALEYIGMLEQVRDLRTALDIVRRAAHPHGKLLIDTFHTFRGGSALDDFDLPRGDEVGLVHINDAPAGDIMQMTDADRVMPGDGAFPLREAIGKLAAGGYEGAVSVEVFSEQWWGRPIAQTARKAAEALRGVMG